MRAAIKPEQRRAFWEKVFLSPVAEMVFSGRDVEAESQLDAMIKDDAEHGIRRGEVYLVGAGPGNPGPADLPRTTADAAGRRHRA